jgi:glycerophosphoryl diester phosphodiesterase
VNEAPDIIRMFHLGVAGITTDYPNRAFEVLKDVI